MEDTDTAADADTRTAAAATDADTSTTDAVANAEAAPRAADEPPPFPSSPSSSSAPSTPLSNPHPPTTHPSLLEGVLTLALPAPNAPPPVPPPISPSSAAAAAATAHRRIPPPCWTHEETLALIDAYGTKWAALRRGNLRTAHWEEVAGDLQARTADLPGAKPKTAMQCRHKIEKLRKRYRSERQRSLKDKPGAPSRSAWVYFRRMDALEFGGGPNPGLPPARGRGMPERRAGSDGEDEVGSESEEDDEEEEDGDGAGGGSYPGIRGPVTRANGVGNGPSPLRIRIPKATRTNRTGGITGEGAASAPARPSFPASLPSISANGRTRFLGKFPGSGLQSLHTETSNRRWEGSNAERNSKKGKRARERDEEEEEDQDPVRGTANSVLERVVAAVRMLGDGFMRMEQMKMDMAREFERARMDMELKHTEMMLQSQRRILDFMIKGITGGKKRKVPPGA